MVADWTIDRLTSDAELDEVMRVEQVSFTNPWTREMYVADLKNEQVSYVYLARDPDGRVVGYCAFWKIFEELHINNLAVVPEHRRAGVARALLTRVISEGVGLGARRAILEVRESNAAARALYERFGFAVTSVRLQYYTNPTENALVLSRDRLDAL